MKIKRTEHKLDLLMNDDGSPITFYHGTSYSEPLKRLTLDNFGKTELGTAGKGFYFSDSLTVPMFFIDQDKHKGHIYSCNLDIHKPLIDPTDIESMCFGRSREEIKDFISSLSKKLVYNKDNNLDELDGCALPGLYHILKNFRKDNIKHIKEKYPLDLNKKREELINIAIVDDDKIEGWMKKEIDPILKTINSYNALVFKYQKGTYFNPSTGEKWKDTDSKTSQVVIKDWDLVKNWRMIW